MVVGTGILLAWLLRWLPRVEPSCHASGAQVAFRFNSFIALAVANQMQRVGQAALPLGLMAVGAGLTLQGLSASPGLASGLLAVRHLVLPLTAGAVAWGLALVPLEQTVLVAFADLPTASSAYVLAARMGGRAAFVAGLVTASTVLGMLSLPLWLAWVQ